MPYLEEGAGALPIYKGYNSSGRTTSSWGTEGRMASVIIRILLDTREIDVDSKDVSGRTPLSYAACYGRQAVIKILLDTREIGVDAL